MTPPRSTRLRRSLLYVPASSSKMLAKAGRRGADVIIVDLEDGVHPDLKAEARAYLPDALRLVDSSNSELWIRVNGLDTPWGLDDLDVVAGLGQTAVVLPKTETLDGVRVIDERLGGSTSLFLMLETAAGILNAPALARSSPRVAGFVFGAADFRETMRAQPTADEEEIAHARYRVLLSARASNIDAFDTPWFEYQNLEGLEASTSRVRRLGFDGKSAIHPIQVAVINRIFSPTPTEVERARRIIEVMDEALGAGRNVAVLDGEMVEALHLKEARRVIERAARGH